jgi:hypothetical protein
MAAKTTRNIKFTTGRVIRRVGKGVTAAFREISQEMTESLRRKIDKPWPPPSTPGTPPHRRTGFLQDSTEAVTRGRTIVIRTPQYGIWLEGGTRNMAPRPFIRPTIHNRRRFWERRLNARIRQKVGG